MDLDETKLLHMGCGDELMLYLHIPFCVKKCRYCDFLSGAADRETRKTYLSVLEEEIRLESGKFRDRRITSIYFGGGTPSLLESEEMERLIKAIRENYAVTADAEVSMECNPGTVKEEKLRGYIRAGINRLSIGLQAAQDEDLALLGRIHSVADFEETYRAARAAGFRNINVDLISGIPGQTPEKWKKVLSYVCERDIPPEHLSVYSLILEEGTELLRMEQAGMFSGELAIPDEDADREIYAYTGQYLKEHGYTQYEISNYAKEGFACRHNCGYWLRRDYLGLGLGAASLLGNQRMTNTADMKSYLTHPARDRVTEKLTREDAMAETMFLGLRMNRGVEKAAFFRCWGEEMNSVYREVIKKNVEEGLLSETDRSIALTDRGRDLSNYVMAQFLF